MALPIGRTLFSPTTSKRPSGAGSAKGFFAQVFHTFKWLIGSFSKPPAAAPKGRSWHLQPLEDRRLLSAVPLGTEFRVNTYTTGPQQTFFQTPQAVAKNPVTGDFVAVWSSQGQSGGGWNVYAQRYDALGNPKGGAFLVNDLVPGANQQYAAVAVSGNGNFVVAWSGHQSGHWDVYAKVFDANGNVLANQILANTSVGSDQLYPSVATDSKGNFAVTWSGHDTGQWNIYARQFKQNGNPGGNEFLVDTPAGGVDQQESSIAMEPNGSFVITWSGHQSGHWAVYAQQFNPAGVGKGVFQVSAPSSADQEFSTVAMDGNGDFVITWSGHQSGSWDVYAQQYNNSGIAQGGQLQVNTATDKDQQYSAVAMEPGGDFVITWSSKGQDDSDTWGIFAQLYRPDGAPSGGEFQVNTYTSDDQEFASVATDGNHQFVVVWSSDKEDGNNWGVYGQLFSSSQIMVTPTTGLVTTEAGGTAAFTVVLNQRPSANVTIGLSSSNANAGTLSTSSLKFTPGNWNTPQTVTVTGVDDHVVNGDVAYQIITAPAVSADPGYNGVKAANVSLTNQENDVAGFQVAPATVQTTEAGVTANFSVALTSQPVAPVTVNLSSSDPSQGTLSRTSLTFDAGNWNVAQTVTVTGLDDHVVNGDQSYQITGTAASADGNYGGLAMTPVTVVNREADVAGIQVTPTSGLTTNTAGGTATFTVALTSQPGADVTIPLSSSNLLAGTVDQASLTFTAGNWNIAQTVTLTGQNDPLVTGDVPYQVDLGPALSADPNYLGMMGPSVWVTNKKMASAAIDVTPSGLVTAETGTTASFRVVLETPPAATVTINLSNSDPAQGSLSTSVLTFDAGNWSVAQVVTVTGLDDHVVHGDQTYQIGGTATSADGNYDGLLMPTVTVVNREADVAGIQVTATSLTTSETGTRANFGVALASQPTAPVTVNLGMSVSGQGALSQSTLTFDPGNWNVAQTVTVTGLDDHVVNGDQSYQITGAAASADGHYGGLAMPAITVVNQEADAAGIQVTVSSLTTSETGTTAGFGVSLTSQPTAPVTLDLGTSVSGQGTLSQSTLTFDAGNWNVIQNVNVTGLDDNVFNGDQSYQISGTATSGDRNYGGLALPAIAVVNQEADVAGIAAVPAKGLVTTQSGGAATFAVSLTSRPVANVTIDLASSNPLAGTVSQPSLTFTAGNWNVAQNVTVTGQKDPATTGDVAYQVVLAPALSADTVYAGRTGPAIDVTNKAVPAPNAPAAPPGRVVSPPVPEPAKGTPGSSIITDANQNSSSATSNASASESTATQLVSTALNSGGGSVAGTGFGGRRMVGAMAGAAADSAPGLTSLANLHGQAPASNRLVFASVRKDSSSAEEIVPGSVLDSLLADRGRWSAPADSPAQPTNPTYLGRLDGLWDGADERGDQPDAQDGTLAATALMASGLIASAGYLLLNTRAGFWLLSLLTSKPLWKEFDPLEILFAWEEEVGGLDLEESANDRETLQSIVG